MTIPASVEIVYIGECDTQSSKASSTANCKGVGWYGGSSLPIMEQFSMVNAFHLLLN